VQRYARRQPDPPDRQEDVVGYVEDLLASNERIVYQTRKHWVAPLFATITGTLLTVAGILGLLWQLTVDPEDSGWARTLHFVLLWGGLLALVVGLALLATAFVRWWSEHYFVTNQKVMKVSGILRKSADGSALEKINDLTIQQTLLGRWLGFGTVTVLTASDQSNLRYTAMRAPMEFRRAVLDEKQQFEQQDARVIAEAVRAASAAVPAAPEAPDAADITATIERLAALRDAGAITPEEFEAKKTELLDRL
jgi:membrane protein YdbS with pleckstrin-like domain